MEDQIKDGIHKGFRYHIEEDGRVLAILPWGDMRFASFAEFDRYQSNNDIKQADETHIGPNSNLRMVNRGEPELGVSVSLSEGSSFSFVMRIGAEFRIGTGPDTAATVRKYDPSSVRDE